MKIAVETRLFAKWDVNVNSGQINYQLSVISYQLSVIGYQY